jgi:phosphopantothenoylcysteine synthetase/decarboxylase
METNEQLALRLCVESIRRADCERGRVEMLWKDCRKLAMQTKELRNPVASWTDHYQRKVDAAAVALLAAVGVEVELVANSHYPLARLLGCDVAY